MSATSRIAGLVAWEALDSRGRPTVACEVRLAGGARGCVVVPSGASTGAHEAHELRDGGARYGGFGVLRAVGHVEEAIGPAVVGADAADTAALDASLRRLDGTSSLSQLGANAVLAVSLAAALAAAEDANVPFYRWLAGPSDPLLPLPMVNVVSGGAHAAGAIDVQDILVVPVGATSFAEAIEWCWRVRAAAAALVAQRGGEAALVADEGGLGPRLGSSAAAVALVAEAIERAGLRLGEEAGLAVDVAATELLSNGRYALAAEGRLLGTDELLDELVAWCDAWPVVSLEDPLAEDDWTGWRSATERLGRRVQLLGDDLFTTDVGRLERGVDAGAANAILVKPNQTGTLSGALAAVAAAKAAGYATVVSARSGDTEDAWLADLAVGTGAGQIKVGSLTRGERTAKWNRLLRIERELGTEARFAGRAALAPGREAAGR